MASLGELALHRPVGGSPVATPRGCRPQSLHMRRKPGPGVRFASYPGVVDGWDNGDMFTRPEPGSIPDSPGSYQFLDGEGRVIYVGKAKSLRSRLSNYFGPPSSLPERTRQMVRSADRVEWIEVNNEVEALFLEFNLIKQHRPRFNIRLKDDKSYPFLAVTLDEEWPRAMVMRGKKRKGVRYFGPYAHAYAIRETLDLLLRTFPIRTCTNNKFDRHHKLGRPCLYAHIEKCAAPCVGDITADDVQGARPGAGRLPRRRVRRGRRAARAPDARRGRRDRVRARGPAAATSSRRCARRSSASRWWAPARRTTTCSGSPRTSSRRRCRCSTSAGAGSSAARASSSTRSKTSRRPRSSRGSSSSSTPTRRRPTSPRRSSSPSSPKTSRSTRSSSRIMRGTKVGIRVPAAGCEARAARHRDAQRTRGVPAAQAAARLRSQRAGPRAWSRCRRRSTFPRRRCGSSASTSPTSRAPRSSRRWW